MAKLRAVFRNEMRENKSISAEYFCFLELTFVNMTIDILTSSPNVRTTHGEAGQWHSPPGQHPPLHGVWLYAGRGSEC